MLKYEIITIISLIIIAFVIVKIKIASRKKISEKILKKIQTQWKIIEEIKTTNPTKAILDADKLLNIALKETGTNGSVGEQLKKREKNLKNLQEIWEAHKLRNKVAHEIFELKTNETEKALKTFKKTISEIIKTNL